MEIRQLYKLYQQYPTICTDSREVPDHSLFFALKGENFDGNRFAQEALEKGAAYAIIDDSQYKKGEHYILVDDSLATLQHLAAYHRRQFDIPVVGITGSNGKTTTKELITQVLSGQYKAYGTKGNLNNHIGLPLSLLEIQYSTEIAVLEMGANHQGEIQQLAEIAHPTHGLITNIGKDHLEGFGGVEGVKWAKGELFNYIKANEGTIFVNADDDKVVQLGKEISQITYGIEKESVDYSGKIDQVSPAVTLTVSPLEITIKSQLVGDYNGENILAAVAVADYFDVSPAIIKKQIENYQPRMNRSQLIRVEGNLVWLDAYNANPVSMKAAISNFLQLKGDKKIAILGDMLELGEYSFDEHKMIVEYIQQTELDTVILVGKEFKQVSDYIECLHFNNVEELRDWWKQQSITDAKILIKGSRGLHLEQLFQSSEAM